ncbi:formin-binding protein 1-like isoform X2 [Oppia nitens]|uniref:formin-binding protein 1-like isoform X2 n=1 Tax=Oppia nitens TaxID=1686743 RepID=UPI0023DBB2EC|nr:formin-binding protein 1-like isoform X2 [Oppia nitens]
MSWGHELWDQYDNLSVHTHRGIEFLDKFGQFVKERANIEIEYAAKLRRLVKSYQMKKKDDEENQLTVCKSFNMMTQEVVDLAGQHETIAENMSAQIVKDIATLLKELKDERKRYLQEGAKNQTALQNHYNQLDKAKKAYEKAYKEAEKAQDNYQKADADLNLSRAEVEKARMIANGKNQMCDECKTEYANLLQKSNELQRRHYTELMPKIFNQLQDMEERRSACIQNFMKQSAHIHRQVFPIINQCLDGVLKASDRIDPKEDSRQVIERFKSGNNPPEDIPFDDLSNPRPESDNNGGIPRGVGGSTTLNYSSSIKSETLRNTLSAARFKKRGGIFGIFASNKDDYADLPPNQRRKRIQAKIDQIVKDIAQETAVRDGLMKMKQAYEQNSALGDPLSVEGQLTENGHKMEKFQTELKRFQNLLAEVVDGKPFTPSAQKKSSSHRNSISEDSLSRSASESSVTINNNTNNTTSFTNNNNNLNITNNAINNSNNRSSNSLQTVITNNHSNHNNHNNDTSSHDNNDSNSPESGISTSHLSIADVEFVDEVDGVDDVDTSFDDPLPSLGSAKALYAFEAQSEGSIAMGENEEFEVVELDQGDGWTRVRRMNEPIEEGFVPTSYIESRLYDNNC